MRSDVFIMMCRGTGPNEHQGNIRFRALVKEHLENATLPKHNGKAKTKLAGKIISAVKARNGRFLKKVSKSKAAGDLYVVVQESVAMEKTKQSFRHQIRSHKLPPGDAPQATAVSMTALQASRPSSSYNRGDDPRTLPIPGGQSIELARDLLKLRTNRESKMPQANKMRQGVAPKAITDPDCSEEREAGQSLHAASKIGTPTAARGIIDPTAAYNNATLSASLIQAQASKLLQKQNPTSLIALEGSTLASPSRYGLMELLSRRRDAASTIVDNLLVERMMLGSSPAAAVSNNILVRAAAERAAADARYLAAAGRNQSAAEMLIPPSILPRAAAASQMAGQGVTSSNNYLDWILAAKRISDQGK